MARLAKKSGGVRWRLWLGGAAIAAVCTGAGIVGFQAHHYATTDARFTLSPERKDALSIVGLKYASRSKVLRVFAQDFGTSVFSIPLAERRRRLLAIDWIDDAAVSRIWPDRLLVQVRERKPIAFVSLPGGAMLVDAQGVLMEPPARAQFAFPVLNGIREDETDRQRGDRVRAFLRIQEDLGAYSKDISEVDVADPGDIRIIARVENRALELIMGDADFSRRYQSFLSHYPEIQKRSPDVVTFDLRLNDRITARE